MMSSMNHIADVSLKGTINACQSEIAYLKERIAAAEEMAKALETIASFAVGNGDVCEIIASRARVALAAWNALK